MAIKEVTMYTAVCDKCGHEAEFGDYTCLGDKSSVREECASIGWMFNVEEPSWCENCTGNPDLTPNQNE